MKSISPNNIYSISTKYYFVFYIAPAAAPTNIALQILGTQSIQVTICPPPQIDQNGLIISYTITYTGNPFDTSPQSMTVIVSLSYPATATECSTTTLTGLEEFNNYTVTVRAVNSIGPSDASSGVTAQTNAAGSNYTMYYLLSL